MAREYYTQEGVNKTLDEVLEKQRYSGLYAPLMARITLYIDDEIPPADRRMMRNNHHAPMCASTDKLKVYIDRKYLYETVNEAMDRFVKEHKIPEYDVYHRTNNLYGEITNILVHELTHTLCQHTHQGKEFFKELGMIDDEGVGQIPKREYMAWMMACEVEANRGYGITKGHSPVYEIGVTDTFTYPKTLGAKYLRDIYKIIYEDYGKQVEDDFKEAMKIVKQMIAEGEKEEKDATNGGNSDGQEGDGQKNDQQEGEGNTSGDAESEDDEGKGQGSSEGEEGEGSEQPDGSQNSSGDSNDEGNDQGQPSPASSEDRKRQEAIARALADSYQQLCERIFDPDFDANDQNIPMSDGHKGQAGGVGGGGIDVSGKTVDDLLTEANHQYKPDIVAKALAHIKGSIVGRVARERVSTYSRQSRKDSSDGLLKKGTKRGSKSMPKILVALDKSGSMSSTTTGQATEALAKIFEVTGRPTQGCWICLHDGKVKDVRPFKQWKSLVRSFWPSGGNDFSDVVRQANRLGVDVVLNVGDGGDRVCRDPKATKEFAKAGRRWIDINITKGSRQWISDWVIGVYQEDYQRGILREWADLTGVFEVSSEYIKESTKKKYNK